MREARDFEALGSRTGEAKGHADSDLS